MPKNTINFSHNYYKLLFPIFSTIRGKSWFPKIKIGQIKKIIVEWDHHSRAIVIDKYLMQIKDIPLEFLQWDTSWALYLGPVGSPTPTQLITVFSHQEFCDLINSFIPSFYAQATLESFKTIIFLEKKDC